MSKAAAKWFEWKIERKKLRAAKAQAMFGSAKKRDKTASNN